MSDSSIRQPFRAIGRLSEVWLFLLFLGGYVALLAWFKYFDIYHTHFSSAGALVFFNNVSRVLSIFYLFWIVQALGAAFLRLFDAHLLDRTGPLEYVALTFFAGTGPWHILLLAIGYLGLLSAATMVMLTVPAVALAFRELLIVTPAVRKLLRERLKPSGAFYKAATLALVLVWGLLLVLKGLDPGAGGGDYFLHYFPAYQTFLHHGGLWPNEVWWHYYYSKGAGLFFLAMLLTDPLAPQLVTFCFFSIAGLSLFLFIRKLAAGTAWPLVGVLLFFGVYLYTPGWGEFGKLHELNTALVVAILWLMVTAFDANSARTVWLVAAASAVTAAVIINTVAGVYLALFFAALALAYAVVGERHRGLVCLALAMEAGALVVGTLAINYVTTGLISDLALRYTLEYADVEKLYQWGALPRVLWWHEQLAGVWGVPLERSANFLAFVLRLSLLWPLVLGGLLVASITAYGWGRTGQLREHLKSDAALILLAAIVVFAALTVTEGRGLSTSFYRFSSFMVPVIIIAGIAMWAAPLRERTMTSAISKHLVLPIVVLASCAVVIVVKTPVDRNFALLAAKAFKYAVGLRSTDDAYVHQSNSRPVGPWGGIYPGSRGAYAVVGPGTPIWSLHLQTYCMLPDCKMMYYAPFLMGRSWDQVMWGTPEEAQAALRSVGLNYFLFSRDFEIRDPLPLSPLFSPENISRYLGIRWTDGTTTLLTWPGPDTTAPDTAWLAAYRRAVDTSVQVNRFPAAAMKAVFDRLRVTPPPSRSTELPWAKP